jgi:hypothetical protein
MFTPPTYLGFLVAALLPPAVVLVALTRRRWNRPAVVGTAVVTLVGLAYTTPWDNALIARGVWWYGEGTVLARIVLAPVEEYLFIVFQPVLTALWVVLLRARMLGTAAETAPTEAAGSVATDGGWTSLSRRERVAGAAAGLAVAATGAVMLTSDPTFYAGAILAWAGPVLALQWAFGWPYLWRHRRLTALAVAVPTAYLAAADRVAIELGIWTISPRFTTGIEVLGLPVEEGAFFLVTNVFVVQGLLLFLWVVDRPAPGDASAAGPLSRVP